MENPGSPPPPRQNTLTMMYWVAAGAMAVALVMGILAPQPDYMAIGSRAALVAALVLLATARPAETRGKKVVIYALVVIALGLLIARLVR